MIWLDNSRILAMFAVVMLHVAAGVVTGTDIGTINWWFGNIYDSGVRWSVPVFVMISGALLLDQNKKEDLTFFYKKRLSKIFIPILIWTFLFLTWAFLKSQISNNEISFVHLLKRILSGKPHYHMWFLYMILCLYLFTPFFRKIIINSTKKELIFFIIITFGMSIINYAYGKIYSVQSKLFINWFLSYIPFFFLGYFIRQDNHQPSCFILWIIFLLSFLLTSIGCYIISIKIDLDTGLYFYGYLSIFVIPMSISIMYMLKTLNNSYFSKETTKNISLLTLGIYLIHPLIIEILNYKQYGAINFPAFISIPTITIVVFSISLGSAWLISKIPYLKRII